MGAGKCRAVWGLELVLCCVAAVLVGNPTDLLLAREMCSVKQGKPHMRSKVTKGARIETLLIRVA